MNMPDQKFKHRGVKFHRFDFEIRGRPKWNVHVSAYENQWKKVTKDDCGRFGNARTGQFETQAEAAEVALERLNRLLITDGECPIEFTE
jgi:hypothetical protein